MAAENEAHIWAVVAASSTGKGIWIKAQLRKLNPRRLVVWDYKNEYGEFGDMLPTLAAVRAAMMGAMGTKPLRVRYAPTAAEPKKIRAQFEALCSLVQAWGGCVFIAEELANVTTPSWAPAAWRSMTTGGRHEGVHIIGVTQTPTLVDKSFLGNATLIHCGPLRRQSHRQAMAADMDVPIERITSIERFHWLERDFNAGTLREGATFPPGGPPSKPLGGARRSSTGADGASQPLPVPGKVAMPARGSARHQRLRGSPK